MTRPEGAADALLERLAEGLRGRVHDLRRAEEQRASFVFREGRGPGRPPSEADDRGWIIHLAHALHAASAPASLDLLASLRREDRTLDEIALTSRPGGDRLAASAWIGDLAAAGLVSRELESDVVSLAPLGGAIVELLEAIAARAAEPTEVTRATLGAGGGGP